MKEIIAAASAAMRDAWIEVDLNAIAHNLRQIRQKLPKKRQIMAIVKADAYGHGAAAIAKTLLKEGIRHFGVATLEEGLELRALDEECEILVLGALPAAALATAVKAKISITIFNRAQVAACLAIARAEAMRPRVHIKLDTGMHRLGVPPQEAVDYIRWVQSHQELELRGLFTHLAHAEHVAHSRQQIAIWEQVIERLIAEMAVAKNAQAAMAITKNAQAAEAAMMMMGSTAIAADAITTDDAITATATASTNNANTADTAEAITTTTEIASEAAITEVKMAIDTDMSANMAGTSASAEMDIDANLAASSQQQQRDSNDYYQLPPLLHLANSTGSLNPYDSDRYSNLCRIGLALYGIRDEVIAGLDDTAQTKLIDAPTLKTAIALRSKIVDLHQLPAGEGVGYNYCHHTAKPSLIATIPLGYADGVPRNLSGKIMVGVRGRLVQQVGNIAMDQMMIDVTDCPQVAVGDIVTLLENSENSTIHTYHENLTCVHHSHHCRHQPPPPTATTSYQQSSAKSSELSVVRWAQLAQTIPYEILCALRARLPKIYRDDM